MVHTFWGLCGCLWNLKVFQYKPQAVAHQGKQSDRVFHPEILGEVQLATHTTGALKFKSFKFINL